MAEFVKVASKRDVPPGTGVVTKVEGREIALFNVDGKFHALDNTCPHMGGPLGEGCLEQSVVTCPWHGWQFDVRTGVSPLQPEVKTKTYEVKLEGEDVLVARV